MEKDEKDLGAVSPTEADSVDRSSADTRASHVEPWGHHFENTYGGLCRFLALLSERQIGLSKVMPGRKIGYDIYGWDVFYPKWRHKRNIFAEAFIECGDMKAPPEQP